MHEQKLDAVTVGQDVTTVEHTAKIPMKFNGRFILAGLAVYMALSRRHAVNRS